MTTPTRAAGQYLQAVMLENYLQATEELDQHALHQSPHWDIFNRKFWDYLRNWDLWPDFRNNAISKGMDDANRHDRMRTNHDHQKMFAQLIPQLKKELPPELIPFLEESSVGRPQRYLVDGLNVTSPTIDFTCFAHRLLRFLNAYRDEPLAFVEIGGGFGGLVRILKALFPASKFMLLDLPPGNAIATYYLNRHFPEQRFYYLSDLRNDNPLIWDNYDFAILPGWSLEELAEHSVSCVINTRSMQEMTRPVIDYYFSQIQRTLMPKGLFYCVNRYSKRVGNQQIRFADYPFDACWQFVFSQARRLQPLLHELVAERISQPAAEHPRLLLSRLPCD